jgi:hypothetical protein
VKLDIDTSSRSEQRKFGLVMAAAIVVIGLLRWLIHGFAVFPSYFFIVAAVFLVAGLAFPKALQPVFVVWIKIAEGMNWVMTRVMLGIAFYVLITPIRLLVLCFGDDPLKRAWLPNAPGYWEDAEKTLTDPESFRNQF